MQVINAITRKISILQERVVLPSFLNGIHHECCGIGVFLALSPRSCVIQLTVNRGWYNGTE